MPFTASHAAAVIPFVLLRHPKISGPALVIGTMTPDFEYFLRAKMYGVFSHTYPGLFAFCLPMGLALVALYHALLLEPLALIAPDRVRAKLLSSKTAWSLDKLGVVVVCVLFGALTHIVWDSATHANRILAPTEVILGMPMFRWLQHASTIVGGLIVLAALWSRSEAPPPIDPTLQRRARAVFVVVVPLCAMIAAAARASLGPRTYGDLIVASISGCLIGTIIASAMTLSHSRSRSSA